MNDKNNINSTLAQEKLQLLQEELRRLGSVLVASAAAWILRFCCRWRI